MAFIYYKHAEVDRCHPRALALCDRCGLVYNRFSLCWQYDWRGAKKANLRLLVCPTCMDTLQDQRRQIVLPFDPIPIEQPRLEPSDVEMNSYYATNGTTDAEGNITNQDTLITSGGDDYILEIGDTPIPDPPYVLDP